MESIIAIGLLSLNACISSYTAMKLAKQESKFKRLHQFGKQNRMVFRELFSENTERYEFLNKLFNILYELNQIMKSLTSPYYESSNALEQNIPDVYLFVYNLNSFFAWIELRKKRSSIINAIHFNKLKEIIEDILYFFHTHETIQFRIPLLVQKQLGEKMLFQIKSIEYKIDDNSSLSSSSSSSDDNDSSDHPQNHHFPLPNQRRTVKKKRSEMIGLLEFCENLQQNLIVRNLTSNIEKIFNTIQSLKSKFLQLHNIEDYITYYYFLFFNSQPNYWFRFYYRKEIKEYMQYLDEKKVLFVVPPKVDEYFHKKIKKNKDLIKIKEKMTEYFKENRLNKTNVFLSNYIEVHEWGVVKRFIFSKLKIILFKAYLKHFYFEIIDLEKKLDILLKLVEDILIEDSNLKDKLTYTIIQSQLS